MTKTTAWMIVFLACVTLYACATVPPSGPILKIEAGMHTAMIRKIATDAQNRFLVTGSEDKTVRVWDIHDGRLLSVLRPPIGFGHEGKIYAVAISPDGDTIACGGYTGWSWHRSSAIYLFDRGTGALIRRISGMPNVINHLAYSRDGRYLAAALWEKGIRVFRTSDYRQVGEDEDYGGQSYGLDFDARNRLVTACYDGNIRLYESVTDAKMTPTVKKKVSGAELPFGVSFSPEGKRIAMCFADSTKIEVRSADDLSLMYTPDTSGIDNGYFSAVAWSVDGRFLFAGGSYHNSSNYPILSWADGGKGTLKGRYYGMGAHSAIMHIIGVSDGGIAYCSAVPALGVFSSKGKQTLLKGPKIMDLGRWLGRLSISRDGRTVEFGSDEDEGWQPKLFSIDSQQLSKDWKSRFWDLFPPDIYSLPVTGWKSTCAPKLNGKLLQLVPHEKSRSLAVAPYKSGFLLGTEWYLRYFDATGDEQWIVPIPGQAWAVNISGNGKLAVAAIGDGTIRWYRLTDGKELLAFFPHKDGKRWVLWTPSGYYSTSVGADDLIGWHLNNGEDQAADFFPINKFKHRFYRPDVVTGVLAALDEALALKQADEAAGRNIQHASRQTLPPVITNVSPRDGDIVTKRGITITYSVRTPESAPVIRVWAETDGVTISAPHGLVHKKPSGTGTLTIRIPAKDCEVSLLAQNRNAVSDPVTIRLKWQGKAAQGARDIAKAGTTEQ